MTARSPAISTGRATRSIGPSVGVGRSNFTANSAVTVAGGTIQWTGPAGQADRLAILLVASLLSLVLPLDWALVCVVLLVLLLVTAVRRASRSIRELTA